MNLKVNVINCSEQKISIYPFRIYCAFNNISLQKSIAQFHTKLR
jgi:hypothetical protein